MQPPSPDVRGRILEAVEKAPAPTRKQWLTQQATWLLAALAIFGGLALGHALKPLRDRPSGYVWVLSVATAAVVVLLARALKAFLLTPMGPSRATLRTIEWATVPTLALAALAANAAAPETLRWPVPDLWIHLWCPLAFAVSTTCVGWLALRATRNVEPVSPRGGALIIAAFIGALGMLAVSIQCDFTDPLHVLLTHVLPVGLFMGAMVRWGTKALRTRG